MKRVLSILTVLCLFLGVSACSSSDDTKDSSDKSSEKKEEKKKEEKKELTVGDTGEADGIKITVNTTRVDAGGDFLKPDEGKVWFIMDITLENTTDEEFSSSSIICYTLKDADGREQDMAIGPELNGSLDTKVPAGETVVGEIAFTAVPEGELFLTFAPFLSDTSVKIKVR